MPGRHPLQLRRGWDQAWVPSPNGSVGAPRQGWINATDGNMYRLWLFTFGEAFNHGDKSNAYIGAYTLYTPLSRRPPASTCNGREPIPVGRLR